MRKKLLTYLCCPDCSGAFELKDEQNADGHVISGSLHCQNCFKVYPIKGGIPRILSGDMSPEKIQTAKSFGYEWKRFNRLDKNNEKEFLSYLHPLIRPADFAGKIILDAGCGMGKFAYYSGKYSDGEVIGVDISDSVEEAYKHTRDLPNVHIIQTDIYKLPFRCQFDFIYSIGVLHHLPEPENGFHKLTHLLKEDGKIFAWVYGKEGNWLYITFADPIRKHITSKISLPLNEFVAFILSGILWIIIKGIYLPFKKIGLNSILPLSDYFLYFEQLSFRIFWGTVLDKMIPPISYYYSRDEFESWFKQAGLKQILIEMRNGNSWRGIGKKHK